MHPSELTDEQLLQACDVRRQRRSGPGGQHRNKVETAVVLVHRNSNVRAEATERRSQGQNRQVALSRLRINLALAVRSARDTSSAASPRWARRCQGGRFRVNVAHDDFAPLMAEALDVIEAHNFDVANAACQLAITSSQLVRFLKLDSRALQQVNAKRESLGLHALR